MAKTRIEQLREEVDNILSDFGAEVFATGAIADHGNGVKGLPKLREVATSEILQACKEAGLAFVEEDAELPRNLWQGDFGYGYAQGRQDMLKAGYRQTKEIDTREPR